MKVKRIILGVIILVFSSLFIAMASDLKQTNIETIATVEPLSLPKPLVLEPNSQSIKEPVIEEVDAVIVEEQPQIDMSIYNDILPKMNEQVINITNEIGPMYNIDPKLLQAIIFYESSNDPQAYNGLCTGYMQIYYEYHADRMNKLGVADLYDPYGNVLVGADYLAELINSHQDLSLALMIYNGDSRAQDLYAQGAMSDYATNIITLSNRLNEYSMNGGY